MRSVSLALVMFVSCSKASGPEKCGETYFCDVSSGKELLSKYWETNLSQILKAMNEAPLRKYSGLQSARCTVMPPFGNSLSVRLRGTEFKGHELAIVSKRLGVGRTNEPGELVAEAETKLDESEMRSVREMLSGLQANRLPSQDRSSWTSTDAVVYLLETQTGGEYQVLLRGNAPEAKVLQICEWLLAHSSLKTRWPKGREE